MSLLNSDDRTFSSEDKLFVEELGRRTGIAIENALLYDKAQEAIRTRDDFLSVASHELKTPITSLGLQLTLAQKSSSPERVGKALDLSQKQVRRLTKLIEDLLDVTRIGTGKLLYNYEKTDLTVLVSETLDRHREQLKDTSSSVEFEGRESISVECDPYRIEQVVSNLLTNAAKYGDSGPVKVGVQQIGECAQFFVQDSGIGIPPERLDKIFERFERGNAPKGISGLGLGLFISREIVKNHGGQITVDSTPGKGSLFIVVLPIVQNSKTN
jgi:signal transduction histidine kinase